MKLSLLEIKDVGVDNQERLVIGALDDCDLGHYFVAIAPKVSETAFSSELLAIKWLNNLEIKKGDFVVVYFKKGETKSKKNANDSTTYFVYWDLEKPLSEYSNCCCVLLEADWSAKELCDTKDEGDAK